MMAMARYVRHEASCLSLTVELQLGITKKQCFLGISCSPPWRTCQLMQEDKMEEVREVMLEILVLQEVFVERNKGCFSRISSIARQKLGSHVEVNYFITFITNFCYLCKILERMHFMSSLI
ncbi:hypothetical protein DKX38_004747 [Salix brachista]|uniref:Uncharacterized protein n=1 Tax=Salix brachista TaxID=2182728 RepID=A0A5N5NDH9_9ROSI|nr:hypothetical protein DKX38_004747 [Salix brachista]